MTSMNQHKMRNFLPESFYPQEKDVIMGRGREVNSHSGNIFLRKLVAAYLSSYDEAKTKMDKSWIIERIVNEIRCKKAIGGFVKMCLHSNRWYDVGEERAKEKISQMFRDILHDRYASSTESRKKQRHGRAVKSKMKIPASASTAKQDSDHNATQETKSPSKAMGGRHFSSQLSKVMSFESDVTHNAFRESSLLSLLTSPLGEFDAADFGFQKKMRKYGCFEHILSTPQQETDCTYEPLPVTVGYPSPSQCLHFVANMKTATNYAFLPTNTSNNKCFGKETIELAGVASSMCDLSTELDPDEKDLLKLLAFS